MEQEIKPFQAVEVGLTKTEMERYGIANPQDIVTIAKQVARYVESQKLSSKIQGSMYVQVEGWQFAASLLGLTAKVVECKNESSYEEVTFKWLDRKKIQKQIKTKKYKYFSTAVFVDSNDREVSKGFAMCSNEETAKHSFDEYAILSMAQTRAIGKAARMSFSFLIKAAGFEPTPLEEMDGIEATEAQIVDTPLPEDIDNEIYIFTEAQQLADWANDQKEYHTNIHFITKVQDQINTLNNGGK